MNDPFETTVGNTLKIFGIDVNPFLLHTILYNFIPAVIFAPYIIRKGIEYNDKLLIIIGIFNIIAELMFFILYIKYISKKDESANII